MAVTIKYYITQISDESDQISNLITNEATILSNTGKFVITPMISIESESGSTMITSEYSFEGSSYVSIGTSATVEAGFGKYTIKTTINSGDPTYLNFYLKAQYTDLSTYEPVFIDRNTEKKITKGTEFDSSVLLQFESQLPFDLEIFRVELDGLKVLESSYDTSGLKSEVSEIGSHEVAFYVRNRDNYNTGSLSSKIFSATFVIRSTKLDWNNTENLPDITLTDIGIKCTRRISDGVEYFEPADNYYGSDLPNVIIDWEIPPKVKVDYILNYYENIVTPSGKTESKSQIIGDFERGVSILNKIGLYELSMTLAEEGLTNTYRMPTKSFVIKPNGITLDKSFIHCSINGMVEIDKDYKYFMKNETVIPDAYYSHYIDGSIAVDVTDRINIVYSLTKDGEAYPYQNGFTQLTEVGKYELTVTVNEVFNDGDISDPVTKIFEFEIKDLPLQLNSLLKDLILRDSETNEVVENKTYNKGALKIKAPKTTEEIPILMYIQGPGFTKNEAIVDNTTELTQEGSYNIELKIVDPNYDKNTVSKYYEIILYNPENHKGENLCPINVYINGILRDMPTGTDSWELPLDELGILGPCNIVAVNAFALNDAPNPENFKYSLAECTFEIVNREYLETPFIYTTRDTNTKWSTTDLYVDYPTSTRLEKCTLEIFKNDETSPCFSKTGTELNKTYKVNDSNTIKLTLPGEILNGVSENGFSLEKNDTLKIVASYQTTLLSETLNTSETTVNSTKLLENYTPYDPGDIILTGFTKNDDIYYTIIPDVMRYDGCEYEATITCETLGLRDKPIELGKELFSNSGVNKPSAGTGKFSVTLTITVTYTDSLGEVIDKTKSKVFYIDRDKPLEANFLDAYITKQIYEKNENIIPDGISGNYNFNVAELRVYLNNRRIYPENGKEIEPTKPLEAFKYIFNSADGQPGLPPGGYNLMITFENKNNGKVVSYNKWFNVVSTPLSSSQKKPLIPLKGKVNAKGEYDYGSITPENEELVQIIDSNNESTGQVAVYKEGLTINKMSELKDSVDYFEKEVTLLQSDIALNESKTNAIQPVATEIRNELKSSLIRKSVNAEVLIKHHYDTCDNIVLADVTDLVNTRVENQQSVSNIRTNGINLNLLIRKMSGRAMDILNTIENYQNLASATAEVMYTYNNNLVTAKNEEILPAGMSVDIYDKIRAIDANGNTNFFVIVPGCKINAKGANETEWIVYDRNENEIAKGGRSTEFSFTVNENLEGTEIKIKAIDLADPNGAGKYKLLSLTMTY